MLTDAHGLAVTTDAADVVAALDDTVVGYLKYTPIQANVWAGCLTSTAILPWGRCSQATLPCLLSITVFLPLARQALASAEKHLPGATAREQAHGCRAQGLD